METFVRGDEQIRDFTFSSSWIDSALIGPQGHILGQFENLEFSKFSFSIFSDYFAFAFSFKKSSLNGRFFNLHFLLNP